MPEVRRLLIAVLVAAALAGAAPARAAGEIPSGVAKDAYLEVATTILGDCGCHPQSVHECACGRAAEMREEIAAALRSGGPGGTPQTAAAVIAGYVAEHGEKIRIAPTVSGFNLVAWIGPSVGLLAAVVVVLLAMRRWRSAGAPAAAAAAGAAPAVSPDDPYLRRVAAEVEERL